MENDKQKNDEKKPQEIADLGENVRGALCYVLGFLSGVFFLLTEKENKFVRFHAMQSVVVFLSITLLMMLPFIGLVLSVFIAPLSLLLWLFLMYKAYQGKKFKLPIIGDFAEQQANKFGK
ncbi:MAG: hypothetical protein U9N04_00225 [Patescibacteria group bacterium]|nr:hypothetical protein [Patescibacteria group bacterium]